MSRAATERAGGPAPTDRPASPFAEPGHPDTVQELETPAALVDVDRMTENLRIAADYCRRQQLGFRPHIKTHKTPELAAEQLRAGASGLTVATPREAEVMAGVADDILMAYPPVGKRKLDRIFGLPEHVRFTVALDSAEALQSLGAAAREHGREVGVLVEADVGMRRVGLGDPTAVVRLAREATETPGVRYRGLMLYPGHIRMPVEDQAVPMRRLSERLQAHLARLDQAGLWPEIVSGGSTPTFSRSHEVHGLTEVRPGTGIFNDRTTALLGACAWTDCAYSVLATVVSTAVAGQAVIDAGSKALAKEEVRATFADPRLAAGYGCVLDRPEIQVSALSEEHGILDLGATDWRPRVGDLVRIVPNHVCVSVNLQDRLWQVRGDQVLGTWQVTARGR
ncbi:MAG TPA: alanine racemase [Longimicrobiales bacterium]|nr:alanine racemase [Longimicrobiales bacterium]